MVILIMTLSIYGSTYSETLKIGEGLGHTGIGVPHNADWTKGGCALF